MNDQQIIVHAAASQIEITDGVLPREVQWMPPGRQTVQPLGFDEPFDMEVTAQVAQAADRQLQHLRSVAAAGKDSEPYGDFNHEDKARSFLPKRYSWGGDDPKKGGIRMELQWTGAGAKAVLDGEVTVVSPSWVLHKVTKAFLGIKHNVGGLVPRSAFHSIQAFAKAQAVNHNHNQIDNMTTEEFQQLLADGLKPINEKIAALEKGPATAANAAATTADAKADDKIIQLVTKAVETAVKPIIEDVKTQKEERQNAIKANATAAVQVHVGRGAIPPEDKDTIGFWENAWIANAKHAEAQMTKLPGKSLPRVIRNAAGTAQTATATANTPEDMILAQAKEARTKNPAAFASDAEALDALLHTPQGAALYEQYRNDMKAGDPRFVAITINK